MEPMEEFLDQNAREFGFSYGLQDTSAVATCLNVQGDAWATSVLAEAETADFAQLPIQKRKIEWLSGRIAAKKAFAQHMATANPGHTFPEIAVLNGRNRAPFILGYPDLTLSISHSSAHAVAVVAPFHIGVDIERIEPRPLTLADYFCCPEERGVIERECQLPDQKDATITWFWSRKEAVAKFLRLGGGLDFKHINTVDEYVCVREVSGERIRLISKNCAGYCISLALRPGSITVGNHGRE